MCPCWWDLPAETHLFPSAELSVVTANSNTIRLTFWTSSGANHLTAPSARKYGNLERWHFCAVIISNCFNAFIYSKRYNLSPIFLRKISLKGCDITACDIPASFLTSIQGQSRFPALVPPGPTWSAYYTDFARATRDCGLPVFFNLIQVFGKKKWAIHFAEQSEKEL